MSKEQMEEEKDDILSNFKKTKRPDLPSDYFESFQKKMLDQANPEEKKKKSTDTNPITFNVRYLYYTVGIAAAVVLVFLVMNNINSTDSESTKNEIVEEINSDQADSTEHYYEYVEENLADFETEDIIDMLAENDAISVEEEVDLQAVPTSEVEVYLLEEYEDLEEELVDELLDEL
jgi:hypothetical protein